MIWFTSCIRLIFEFVANYLLHFIQLNLSTYNFNTEFLSIIWNHLFTNAFRKNKIQVHSFVHLIQHHSTTATSLFS